MRIPFYPTPSVVLTIIRTSTLLVGEGSGVLVTLTFIVTFGTTVGAGPMSPTILGGISATTKLTTTALARCGGRRFKIGNLLLQISNKANKVVGSDTSGGGIN